MVASVSNPASPRLRRGPSVELPESVSPSGSQGSKPISERKRRANRRNARKSTGPTSSEGKARSSRNAIVHGLFSADVFLFEGESRASFLLLRESFINDLAPQNSVELMLVERIALAQWKLRRLHGFERARHQQELGQLRASYASDLNDLQNRLADQDIEVDYSRWCRDFAHVKNDDDDSPKRVYNEAPDLHKRAERMVGMLQRIGDQRLPMEVVQLAQLGTREGFDEFERLGRHEQRLENSIYRALRELDRRRKGNRRRKSSDVMDEDLPPSPYRSDPEELFERASAEMDAERDDDANPRNEATDSQSDASDDAAKDLATDGAPMSTDEKESPGPSFAGIGAIATIRPPSGRSG